MTDVPEFLESGEPARLIPVAGEGSRERRATSILLAGLMAVDELAKALLGHIGQRLGTRAKVHGYTEVVFKKRPTDLKERPDGLLLVSTGRRTWSAIVEAKVGRSELREDQIKGYLQLTKLNGLDAVITVSNQFAALPTHHPVRLPKSATKGVDLFHWSWMHVLTTATLLQHDDDIDSPEQRFILDELLRYFAHDASGIASYDRMNPEWKELVGKVQSRAPLARTAPEVENSVAAWHQEQRDLCLIISRRLGRDVRLKLSRAHTKDPVQRLKDDCAELVKTAKLTCVLDVPDAAAPITVTADVSRRTLSCAMRLEAPGDRKRASARINWLVRQLGRSDASDIHIKAIWPKTVRDTQASLADVRESAAVLEPDNRSLAPKAFEVILVRDLAGKFSGTRTFIEHLETVVPEYYEQVGQHLRAYVPPPPKPLKRPKQDASASPVSRQSAGDTPRKDGPSQEHPTPDVSSEPP